MQIMRQIYISFGIFPLLGVNRKRNYMALPMGAFISFITEGAYTKEIACRGVGEYDTEFYTRNCERHDAAVRCLVLVTVNAHLIVVLKARAHVV